MATTQTDKLSYVAVHTRGYDSTHDLVILAGAKDSLDAMFAMADRVSTVNGKRHVADPSWVFGMAEHSPHFFYGYKPGEGSGGAELAPAVRITLTAQRTARDISAPAAELMVSEWDRP